MAVETRGGGAIFELVGPAVLLGNFTNNFGQLSRVARVAGVTKKLGRNRGRTLAGRALD